MTDMRRGSSPSYKRGTTNVRFAIAFDHSKVVRCGGLAGFLEVPQHQVAVVVLALGDVKVGATHYSAVAGTHSVG